MKLKKISSYLTAIILMAGMASCEGEKDLVIIDGDLPIKTSTLYMVGDATPNGWSIDAPTPFTATEADPLVFTWEGALNPGEMKLCLVTGSWDAPFIRPINNGDKIGRDAIADKKFDMHAGDPDNKWKITDAGIYSLTFDLRNWTYSSVFVGQQSAPEKEPIAADALYIVGDATPNGWNIDSPNQLEKKSDYIFIYEAKFRRTQSLYHHRRLERLIHTPRIRRMQNQPLRRGIPRFHIQTVARQQMECGRARHLPPYLRP